MFKVQNSGGLSSGRYKFLAIGLAVSGLSVPVFVASAAEPAAPATPDAITAYRDSGEWLGAIAKLDSSAQQAIKAAVAKKRNKADRAKLVLVLDIDETSLDNYPCMKPMQFTKVAQLTCSLRGQAPAFPSTLSLYRYAQKQGVSVFFITGRPEGIRKGTVANLKAAGFGGKYTLLMPSNNYDFSTLVPFKSGARKSLVKKGYTIVANVGDQQSDLTGGYSKATFKLPNPMYVTK